MIVPLHSSPFARRFLPDLLLTCADQPWAWGIDQFLMEKPRKWALSFLDVRDEETISVAIVSEIGPNHHHVHLLAVPVSARGQGIGTTMIGRVQSLAHTVTLKVPSDNLKTQQFYYKLGFTFELAELNAKWLPMKWTWP